MESSSSESENDIETIRKAQRISSQKYRNKLKDAITKKENKSEKTEQVSQHANSNFNNDQDLMDDNEFINNIEENNHNIDETIDMVDEDSLNDTKNSSNKNNIRFNYIL
jgi:hypothetical protein